MRYILAIDQSTSGTKAGLLDEQGSIVKKASLPHAQYYPAPAGWSMMRRKSTGTRFV